MCACLCECALISESITRFSAIQVLLLLLLLLLTHMKYHVSLYNGMGVRPCGRMAVCVSVRENFNMGFFSETLGPIFFKLCTLIGLDEGYLNM